MREATHPENTLPGFIAAAEAGVDQIETDVRITRDGYLVTIHDETVDRTTNGAGKVCDYTLEELKKLDAGYKKGEEFKGTQIPTFIEFMDVMKQYDVKTLDKAYHRKRDGSHRNRDGNRTRDRACRPTDLERPDPRQ